MACGGSISIEMASAPKYPGAGAGVLTVAAITGVIVALSLSQSEGRFTYALDDAYIHMAVAKNLAQEGVWGVTAREVSSSSSSILWGLILAGTFALIGVRDLAPFFLNLLLITIFCFYLARQLAIQGVPVTRRRFLVPALLLFTSILLNIFTGMEHIIHALLSLAVMIEAVKILEQGRPTFRDCVPLFILAPLLTMARYEGLFLIAVVCVLMTLRRGFFPAVAVCLLAIAPLIIFGVVMVSAGQAFLPYSILLKTEVETGAVAAWSETIEVDALANLFGRPRILLLLVGLSITLATLLRAGTRFWSTSVLLMLIPIAVLLLHAQFASFEGLRYLAYVVTLIIFSLAVVPGPLFDMGLRARPGRRVFAWGVLSLTVLVSLLRLFDMPRATVNIYQQQRQMAEFFDTYYDGEGVAINDIGATAYFADINLVDLWGLGSATVAEAKIAGNYGPQAMDALCEAKDVKVAIVYDFWFEKWGGLPAHWVKVGQWRIPHNVVCADDTVDIYAVDPDHAPVLIQNLRAFSDALPAPVEEFGPYTTIDRS